MSYRTDKLELHPDAVRALREGRSRLLTVHLMPQNVCNQSCSFCSYRMPQNKNSSAFDLTAHIPEEHIGPLISDLVALDVKGVELTGGGEPLAYPHLEKLLRHLGESGIAVGLVTNGTLLTPKVVDLLTRVDLRWVRVSIDAATESAYRRMRKAPRGHFEKAWRAVELVSERAHEWSDFQLGVGFVLSNENVSEVPAFVKEAKERGADNVRLAVTYSDQHGGYFKDHEAVQCAIYDAALAKAEHEGDGFRVVNLMSDRWAEVVAPGQDYPSCPTQQVLCVVEGTGQVYTCCTFTGSEKGKQGVFWEHPEGFAGLWREKEAWRAELDPRTYCDVSCLYEKRNLRMLEIIDAPPVHPEFI